MLGAFYLSWLGLLDLSLVYLSPTYLKPQLLGGALLGFGFVVGGYCPGTSVVATASRRLDGLANRIVRGNVDFRLLDLRDEEAYAEYHIPGAELVPIGELPDYPLLRNELIFVYSDGGIHAAQGWFLLKAEGYPAVYAILGGLDAWKDEILFPALPGEASPEQQAAFEQRRFLSEFFGGSPVAAGRDLAAMELPALPKVEAVAQPRSFRRKKARKEGC